MERFIFLLLMQFFPLWGISNSAGNHGAFQVSGRVTDSDSKPLVGATVVLENSMLGVTTNTDGYFFLAKLRPGNYFLVVSYIGYETQRLSVELTSDKNFNIILKPLSVMCDEVVVSATRASGRMPIAQSTLEKDDVKSGNSGSDIPFQLEMLPSVVATSEGGTGIGNTAIRIRGTDMTRINITVNGIPLNDAESQGVYWVDLPDFASSVDNVQVQRGVGTSTNGAGAFGATVNFQTSTLTPEPFASVNILAGSYNTWKTSAIVGTGLIDKKFSFEGRYSQLRSDGYVDRGGSDHKSMFLTGAWHSLRSLVRLNIIHGEEHTGITWEGTPGYILHANRKYNPAGEYTDEFGNTKYYPDQKDNYWQTHYQLIASHSLTENLRFNATLHLTDGKGYYEEYKQGNGFSEYGLPSVIIGEDTISSSDFIHRKWMDNSFYGAIASLNYNRGKVEATVGGAWNEYDGNHFGRIMWTSMNTGLPKDYEWYRNKGTKKDWNIYAKAIWQPGNWLSLFADVQYRGITYGLKGVDSDIVPLHQQHDWGFVNPKMGATFGLHPFGEIYGSFGVANREPSRSDLQDAQKGVTDYTPKSERLYDWEVGYKFKRQTFAFNTNIYYMKYKDQLVLTGELTDVGNAVMANVPNSYRAGVELIVGIKPVSWLKVDLNTTLSRNIIEDYTNYIDVYDNPDDWNPLPQEATDLGSTTISFSPSVVGSSQVSVMPFKSFIFSWISKYVGSQYIDNTQSSSRELGAYWVNNLKAEYRFAVKGAKSIFLQGMVNNVFNRKYVSNGWIYRAKFLDDGSWYVEDGYFPQAEINFTFRLGVEF